jgi:hypothetical protein
MKFPGNEQIKKSIINMYIFFYFIKYMILFRISKLEFLDELEEWRLLASHYCIAWAYIIKDISAKSLFDYVKFDNYKNV